MEPVSQRGSRRAVGLPSTNPRSGRGEAIGRARDPATGPRRCGIYQSLIFHIARTADWDLAQAAGRYWTMSGPTSSSGAGCIEAVTTERVEDFINANHRGAIDLVVLVIDTARLTAELRYERTDGSPIAHPRIYGSLNLEAVLGAIPLDPDAEGLFRFHLSEDSLLALYLASGRGLDPG